MMNQASDEDRHHPPAGNYPEDRFMGFVLLTRRNTFFEKN